MKKSAIPIAHRSHPKQTDLTTAQQQYDEEELQNETVPAVEETDDIFPDLVSNQPTNTGLLVIDLDRYREGEDDSKTDQLQDLSQLPNMFGNLIPTSDEAFIPFHLVPDLTVERLPAEIAAKLNLVPPQNGRRLNCAIMAQSLHNPKDYTYYSVYSGKDPAGGSRSPWSFFYFFPIFTNTSECYYDRTWRKSASPLNMVLSDGEKNVAEGAFFGIDLAFLSHLTFEPFAVPTQFVLRFESRFVRLMRIQQVVLLGNVDEMAIAQICQSCRKLTSSPQELFQRCSACKWAWYCSKQCQANHWMFHKRFCDLYQKAGSTSKSIIEHVNVRKGSRPYEMVLQRDLLAADAVNIKYAQHQTAENGNGHRRHVEEEQGSYLDEVD